jgi:hypothetical protein
MSSGAAHFGSPLSAGSAGAKAAIRVLCSYAADESCRAGLDIRFVSVLPKVTPATDLGAVAVAAYGTASTSMNSSDSRVPPPNPSTSAGRLPTSRRQPSQQVRTC